MQISPRLYLFFYAFVFLFLSIPALKLTEGVRVGQFMVLALFGLILIDDILCKRLKITPLAYFMIGALVMTLVSLGSIETKWGEMKFVTKYFLIFPATYYVGVSVIEKIGEKRFIVLLEAMLFVYALNAFLIAYAPLPAALTDLIVSYRTAWSGETYLDFQGTFFEAGWLGMVVGSTALVALLLRIEYDFWPQKKALLLSLYLFVLMTLGLSKNKTVWIAIVLILLFLAIYKSVVMILHSNKYQPKSLAEQNRVLRLLAQIDAVKVLLIVVVLIVLFLVVNNSLATPLISMEMIKIKMEQERGKAFLVIWDLLEKSNYFGGYGFGFVEAYFTLQPQSILGLGEGTAMVFNSYLDIWLAASLFGLIFHLGLLVLSSSNEHYITLIIPMFYFVFANFNPATGDEYYYLFLGLSFGLSTALTRYKKEKNG